MLSSLPGALFTTEALCSPPAGTPAPDGSHWSPSLGVALDHRERPHPKFYPFLGVAHTTSGQSEARNLCLPHSGQPEVPFQLLRSLQDHINPSWLLHELPPPNPAFLISFQVLVLKMLPNKPAYQYPLQNLIPRIPVGDSSIPESEFLATAQYCQSPL